MIEICCGSYKDGIRAYRGGAKRIELNSALFLGGLTPSIGTLKLLKKETTLTIICMVRPRGAGFTYDEMEYKQMLQEAQDLLENGADGLAFGFLNPNHTVNIERTKTFVELIHCYHATAVFHRAFDCCQDFDSSLQQLIELGVDRVLTSGGHPTAVEGIKVLKYLQEKYGKKIEILAGSGVNASNAFSLMNKTDLSQVHSSCKNYETDPTTIGETVSYSYYQEEHRNDYESVDQDYVEKLVNALQEK